MEKIKDLTGQKIGKLTVKELQGVDKNRKALWLCQCECDGNIKIYKGILLINGHVKSCGCLRKDKISKMKKKYNTYDLTGIYGIGYTFKGEEFYFDLEDYDLIKECCWYLDPHKYVITRKNKSLIRMHRLIMNVTENEDIDHIFHINYDNRKSELRIVNDSQNQMNEKLQKNNISGVTGVCWVKSKGKWKAQIGVNNTNIFLGYFNSLNDAINTRKEAEEKYFGEYSYNNSMKKKLVNKIIGGKER